MMQLRHQLKLKYDNKHSHSLSMSDAMPMSGLKKKNSLKISLAKIYFELSLIGHQSD